MFKFGHNFSFINSLIEFRKLHKKDKKILYKYVTVITCYFSCFKRNTISVKPYIHTLFTHPILPRDMLEWSGKTTWVCKFYSNECLHLLRLLLFWQTEFSAGIVIVKNLPHHHRVQERFLRTKKNLWVGYTLWLRVFMPFLHNQKKNIFPI